MCVFLCVCVRERERVCESEWTYMIQTEAIHICLILYCTISEKVSTVKLNINPLNYFILLNSGSREMSRPI